MTGCKRNDNTLSGNFVVTVTSNRNGPIYVNVHVF